MTIQPVVITADVPIWDAVSMEWRTVAVPVPPAPKRRAVRRRKRPARPVNRSGLSNGSPFAYGMDDTAFAPATGPAGFADMRTYIPPAAMATHRPAVVMPADKGAVTERDKRRA